MGLGTWTLHFSESFDGRILILSLPVEDSEGKREGEATVAIAAMAHGRQSWAAGVLVQFLVHPDFLNTDGGFSDLDFHSSSHDFVRL